MYTPIPRDRDQVFYNTSGVFPWIVSHQWLMSKFQGFHNNIRDISGFNFNARYFDRYFLNALSEQDWQEQVAYLQDHITDSVINVALHLLPDSIFTLSGEKIIETLKARRTSLLKKAIEYYRFIAKVVEVPASDKHELFQINFNNEGNVELTIFKIKKDGTKDKMIYKRVFLKGITKEIRLYGFDGRNIFSVSGDKKNTIKIRMVGGADKDSFMVAPNIKNKSKLFVYDKRNGDNILPLRSQAKIRVSDDSAVNRYNDQSFKYDRAGPLVLANYNIDQGLLIKLGYLIEKQGFRKEPYAQKQQLMANYATARKSYVFDYAGDFKNVISNNDLNINIVAKGPRNTGNFFGIGNQTEFINKSDNAMDYYRTRYDIINADITLKHPLTKHNEVYAGLATQYYTAATINNNNRFLNKFNTQYPLQQVFTNKVFAGIIAGLIFDTRNDQVLPSKGFYWNTIVTGMQQLGGSKNSYAKLFSDFSWYAGTGKKANLIIANRVGTQWR